MRTATLGIVLTAAIVIAGSCAGRQGPRGKPIQDEITALWTQIRDWRREAGLPVDPRREDVMATPPTVKAAESVCPEGHAVPATCGEVCSLADAICDNAEQICILADELGKSDKWAQDKCASAKASCRDAKQRCCKCSDPAKASFAW